MEMWCLNKGMYEYIGIWKDCMIKGMHLNGYPISGDTHRLFRKKRDILNDKLKTMMANLMTKNLKKLKYTKYTELQRIQTIFLEKLKYTKYTELQRIYKIF